MNLLPPKTPISTDQMCYRHDRDLGIAEHIGPSFACIVIMPDTLSSENFDAHYNCCEMVPINWFSSDAGDPGSEDGILLEVWKTGGLVHSCLPIPEDSLIELGPESRIIQAQVSSCEPDKHYGFLVQVSVDPDHYDNWFPGILQLSRPSVTTSYNAQTKSLAERNDIAYEISTRLRGKPDRA